MIDQTPSPCQTKHLINYCRKWEFWTVTEISQAMHRLVAVDAVCVLNFVGPPGWEIRQYQRLDVELIKRCTNNMK